MLRIGESGCSPSRRNDPCGEEERNDPCGEGDDGEAAVADRSRDQPDSSSDERFASPSAPASFRTDVGTVGERARAGDDTGVVCEGGELEREGVPLGDTGEEGDLALSGAPLISPTKLLRRLSLLTRRMSLVLFSFCKPTRVDWVRRIRKAGKSFMSSSLPFLMLSSSI